MTLTPSPDDPWIATLDVAGLSLPLLALGGIHPTGVYDGWSEPVWKQAASGWDLECRSTQWDRATIKFRPVSGALEVGLEVEGKGDIDVINFLEGALAGRTPHPQNTMAMVRHNRLPARYYGRATPVFHQRVFNPQPEARTGPWLEPAELSLITVAGTFGPDRFDTFFSPGIWCYVLDLGPEGFLSLGLVAEPGTQHFHTFEYRGGSGFGLAVKYDGKVAVDGTFSSPRLRIGWHEDADGALKDYTAYLRDSGRVAKPAGKTIPDWWRRPFFCGWGSQVAWSRLARNRSTAIFDQGPAESSGGGYATQEVYGKMVSLLEEHRLPYGTLIIDMGWSHTMSMPVINTERWPDLPGFIRGQHAKGKRVLLWLSCWAAAEQPQEYLIEADAGLKPVIDPTRPAFREKLQKEIAWLVGPEVDADGFKLDFTGDGPRGPGYRPSQPIYGLELLREYLKLIQDAMKAVKPEALMMTHCANPYLGDVTDVLRLNDLFFDQIDIREGMAFRARMARIACPEWLIDCDGDPFNSPESWLQYKLFQPSIGIPSLYDLTHTSGATEPIPAESVAKVRAVWEKYLLDNGL